ncbi:hypothetical protein D3C80_2169560 [compost metagenome]
MIALDINEPGKEIIPMGYQVKKGYYRDHRLGERKCNLREEFEMTTAIHLRCLEQLLR